MLAYPVSGGGASDAADSLVETSAGISVFLLPQFAMERIGLRLTIILEKRNDYVA